MTTIALDSETLLISSANKAPKLVCISFAEDVNHAQVVHAKDPACKRIVFELLSNPEYNIVGQNISFDMGVFAEEWPEALELIFAAYDAEKIYDSMVRQQLLDIAEGCFRGYYTDVSRVWVKLFYGLGELAERYDYPVKLDKDTWRLRYGELLNVPVENWPKEAIDYPEHDAKSTLWVARRQEEKATYLADQHRQVRAAWALHLVSAWGIRTDQAMVDRLRKQTQDEILRCEQILVEKGFAYRDKKGGIHKRQKQIQEYALTINPNAPKTPTGLPKLDADAIPHYNGDKFLEAYQQLSSVGTVNSRLKELEWGLVHPIHTRFDLVETGRTNSEKPNLQNRAVEPGDRECFVPRKGFVFVDIDYDGLELRTWAQCCIWMLGHSKLAEVLNQPGADPHAMIAAELLHIPLPEMMKRKKNKSDKIAYEHRQMGKVVNFGAPGGVGEETLRAQARQKYNVILDPVISEYRILRNGKRKPVLPQTQALIRLWKGLWPEAQPYLDLIQEFTSGPMGTGQICHLKSNRYRGQVKYTEAANSFFQGLGADAAKSALYALVKECYIGKGVLRGSRVVNFIHDQVLVEVPEEAARECAKEVQRIWVGQANEWLVDVPATAEPMLCRRWSKLAGETVNQDTGEIVGVVDANGVWEWIEAIKAGSKGYAA